MGDVLFTLMHGAWSVAQRAHFFAMRLALCSMRITKEVLMKFFKFLLIIAIIFSVSSFNSCSKKEKETVLPEKILAKIGEKDISLNEFIRRAEYTIRPRYCKGSTNIDKKIILNSLIAEKMLAMEAGEGNELMKDEHFQRSMQGRKEQLMREWMYNKDFVSKVKLESEEVNRIYRVAGRKYKINYFTVKEPTTADQVERRMLIDGKSFEEVYFELAGTDTIPEKEVEWQLPEQEIVHKALYSDTLVKNQVIGPLLTEDGHYIVMKVKGWTNRVAISEKDINQRVQDVKEKLTQDHAIKSYAKYVGDIMKGKRMEFSPGAFKNLVNVMGPLYLASEQTKRELFLNKVLDKEIGDSLTSYEDAERFYEEQGDSPLFKVDDQVWTVNDFKKEVEIHPLVFRKKQLGKGEFAEQMKLAIVDMVRDRYIADAAYKKGYDKVQYVKRNSEMWQDAMVGLYQKYKYLEKIKPEEKDMIKIIDNHLNPYIDELQKKYNDVIEVEVDDFNDVQLTRIDMFVKQQNVPFPIVVPSFPQITTDPWLDYGRKMNQSDTTSVKQEP